MKAKLLCAKLKKTTIRSLAVQHCPDLWSRGRGKLNNVPGEETVTPEMMRQLTHVGDETALKAWQDEHEDELRQELADRRQRAELLLRSHSVPYTNSQVVAWLDDHEERWQQALRTATPSRKNLGERLSSGPLPALPRLRPEVARTESPLLTKLLHASESFVGVRTLSGRMVVMFCSSYRGIVWGLPLRVDPLRGHVFLLDHDVSFHNRFRPVDELAEFKDCFGQDGPHDCEAWEFPAWRFLNTDHDALEDSSFFSMVFHRSRKLDEHLVTQRKAKRRKLDEAGDPPEDDEGVEEDMRENSELEMVASDLGSDVEKASGGEQETSEDGETDDEDGQAMPRAARGTHVVRRNPYFYMVDDPGYHDCKMLLVRKWVVELKSESIDPVSQRPAAMSRTLTVLHYDHAQNSPTRTQLALRAWMCWRAKDPAAFLARKSKRQHWWDSEVSQLREDIIACSEPDGKTGSAAADALITMWCPDAFLVGGPS
jgi:hypothetical protein